MIFKVHRITLLCGIMLFADVSCTIVKPCKSSYYPSEFFPKKWKKDICFALSVDISAFEENYQKTKNDFFFNEAIKLIDSALRICNNRYGLIESKFNLHVMRNDYQDNDIEWFARLDSSYYFDDFSKIFYVNTLKSLLFDRKRDTVSRDRANKEIIIFMEEHVFDFPSNFNWQKNFMQRDKKMFATYYYVRGRYEDINLLKKELQDCCMNKNVEMGNDNQENIEKIIFMLDSMNKKSYHFEY